MTMVFKLIRGGRKIRELEQSMDDEKKLSSYIEKSISSKKRHPIKEDIDILNRYIDYIKFSRPASLSHESKLLEEEAPEPLPRRGKTTLPIAFISDLTESPERWSGRHVIIDGEIEHVNTNRNGEHWHRFRDNTGTMIAVSRGPVEHQKGTLFGVARQTPVGKQLFLEIKSFHSIQST